MKTAIIYATKTNATETYARLLAEQVENCTLVNLAHDKVDLDQFDKVVLGGGVRMSTAYKPLRSFINKNLDALVKKPVWIFFSGVNDEGFDETRNKNVPEELRESAKSIVLLKGIAPFDKKDKESGEWIEKEALTTLAQSISA